MSVQAGVWHFDGRPVEEQLLDRMSDELAPYAPDGRAQHTSGPCTLLYMASHTTKESRLEEQPHVSQSGNVITWDGRLDNRNELISKLNDDLRGANTDLEIVSAAYERWSTDCFPLLLGDWALSIWNPREKILVLARDYIGVRHLYYLADSSKVIWSSRLESIIVSSDSTFTLSDEYIAGFLAKSPEAHLTPYREVQAVRPGGYARIRHKRVEVYSYWTLNNKFETRYKSDVEYEDHFRQLFRLAVRRRLRSDSPMLAELSGGLDSSSVVCMADDVIAKGEAKTPRLDTLSYYDPQSPGSDERPFIQKVEEQRGRVGHHISATEDSRALTLTYPFFIPTPGSLPRPHSPITLLDDRGIAVAPAEFRVVLSGAGGDEFLGGVCDPRSDLADLIARIRLRQLFKEVMAWSLARRQPWIQLLLQSFVLLIPPTLRRWVDPQGKIPPWIDSNFARRFKLSTRRVSAPEGSHSWLPSAQTTAETFASLTYYFARHQPFGHCQERWYPYLDRTLIEFLISIPPDQIARPGQRRSLMRRSLVELVPPEVLFRKTKGTGTHYLMAALTSKWMELETIFRSPLSSTLGYIDGGRLKECLIEVRHGKTEKMLPALRGLSLELWIRDLVKRGIMHNPVAESLSLHTEAVQSGA